MLTLRPLHSVVWNLFLAIVPVVLAFVMAYGLRGKGRHGGSKAWLLLLPVWLGFLPNTAYLLTEWRHFLETVTAGGPLLTGATTHDRVLDLLVLTGFYVFYSGAGLLCFFLAVWPLDRLARRRWGRTAWACQAAVFLLCGLGVYVGLVPRFNTWDILHPTRSVWLSQTIADTLTHPTILLLIAGFSAVLWLAYMVFDMAMDGAALRLRRLRSPAAPDTDETVSQKNWHHALK